MGATAASALLVRPWVGLRVDTKGSRPAVLFGQLLLFVALAGYLGISGFTAFFCLRLLFGLALAFYGTGAMTFASTVESGERAAGVIAIYTLITMLAVGGAMGVAQITFEAYGFRVLIVISLALISVAGGVMSLRARPIKPVAGAARLPFFTVLKTKVVLAATASQFAASFSYGALFTFIPLASLAKGVPFYSLFFISFAASVIVSRFFVQRADNRFGLEKAILYASFLVVVSVMIPAVTISPVSLVLSGALYGIGFGLIFPSLVMLLMRRISQTSRGTSLSILIAAGDVGSAISAALLGVVAEHLGYPLVFTATVLILMLNVAYFYKTATAK